MMESSRPIPSDGFLVSFSFAGEQRSLVHSIAAAVEKRLGEGTVFYDEWFEYYLAGSAADAKLQSIYTSQTKLVVACVSSMYGGKPWTLAEYDAIRALHMRLRSSPDKRDSDRILPLRVGEGEVEGILFNTIAPDVRSRDPEQTADLIINRLRYVAPDLQLEPGRAQKPAERCVYLGAGAPDLNDPTKPVNRARMQAFLEDLGWTVLPTSAHPEVQRGEQLFDDLQRSSAFIQLLGAEGSALHAVQYATARSCGRKCFRYRSAEIDLGKVDAGHRALLSEPEIMTIGFEDFKAHVASELAVLARRPPQAQEPERDDSAGACPRILVSVRSANPDPLWEKAYQWIYEEEGIDYYQLAPGETFDVEQQVEPCHGFMIVCDADAAPQVESELRECRLIQLRERTDDRRPPVGLVYWPPPPAEWPRLLRRVVPRKLHRIVGDDPANRSEFFADVRRAAQ